MKKNFSNVWWKNAVGYQIYIRSFFDSNNDGIGDLNGINEKLDYLKNLGVDFIWICPFYDSPMDDNGYDVRDYFKIDEIFGNMSDLENLIDNAHKKNIKVVVDLVLNHTSDEHIWFQKSEEKIEPYTDFYVWKDGNEKDGKLFPPTNWTSFFSGSAWKYSPKRKQYFLKIFSNKMPDINYENENVFVEIEKIIEFYAKINVDGFRVDAIAHIGKDLKFRNANSPSKSYKRFSNLPNTHRYLKRLNGIFKKYDLVTMGELGGDPTKKDILKYTTENELDMVFSFEQMGIFTNNSTIDRKKLLNLLKSKYSIFARGGQPVLFWLNHDYPRLLSKLKGEIDPENSQLSLATLMYFLPGTPIIYNGEEIGMKNYPFSSPDDFNDVNARMLFENSTDKEKTFENLKENSRDNARTVMQWSDDEFAGFSSKKPCTFVNENHKKINVKFQENEENSILSNYKKIIKTRKIFEKEIQTGAFKFFNKSNLLGYKIETNEKIVVIVSNLNSFEVKNDFFDFEQVYSNFDANSMLKPYQIAVFSKNK